MSKTFDLSLYGKQGEDLRRHLDDSCGNAVSALLAWADELQAAADHAKAVAREIEKSGKAIEIYADKHGIGLAGDAELLAELAAKKLITVAEYKDGDV